MEADNTISGLIPLDRLSEFQPFETSPWSEAPGLRREDVEGCLRTGRLEAVPYSSNERPSSKDWNRERHAARIAWLVTYPSEEPIHIEFTEPGEPWMELTDGWHRLAAAQFSEAACISVSLFGFVDHCVSGLGAICRSFQSLEDAIEDAPDPGQSLARSSIAFSTP